MKNTLYFWQALLLIGFGFAARAQMEGSAFTATGRGGVASTFVTDYQAIGINPANLAIRKSFNDPKLSVGAFDFHSSIYVEALTRDELFASIFRPNDSQFDFSDKASAADRIANTDFSTNVDVMLAGVAYNPPGPWGFAFSVRDRIQLYTRVSQDAADIMFLGAGAGYFPELVLTNGQVIANPRSPGNEALDPLTEEVQNQIAQGRFVNNDTSQASFYSEILDGTRVSSSWFREYNFAVGRQLIETYDFELYVGGGVKFLQGITLIDLQAEGGELTQSNISVSPSFGLDFGDSVNVASPSFEGSEQASTFEQFAFPKPVGQGFGLDFGLTMIIKRSLRLSAAINNFGTMTWDGNVYEVADGRLAQFAGLGFNNYNVAASTEGAFQFAGDKSPLEWTGASSITVDLPYTIRFGASYEYFRTFHVGFDIIMPQNDVSGNLERTLWAVGGEFRPSRIFTLSSGLNAGGNNGDKVNVPFGITYRARKGFYEAGISTRDIVTYFGDAGGSTFSFAGGFFRLHFY